MKIFLIPSLILLLFQSPVSPSPSSAAEFGYQGTHVLTHGVLEDLARAFQAKYDTPVFVKGGGCPDGIAAVVKDRYTMGGLCCPLSPEMASRRGLVTHRVAIDIKAVIVHPENPVANLSLEQVAAIHKGTITSWGQAGGEKRPMALINREHCRDMAETVRQVLGIEEAVAAKAIIVKTDQEIVEYVEKFPAAIGVVSKVLTEGARVKAISVDHMAPTPGNAEKGLYRLQGDLFLVTKGRPAGLTGQFIDFVLSGEGQAIVGKKFGRIQ